jgi:hypothetical protein
MPCIVVGTYAAFLDFINISGYLSVLQVTFLNNINKRSIQTRRNSTRWLAQHPGWIYILGYLWKK